MKRVKLWFVALLTGVLAPIGISGVVFADFAPGVLQCIVYNSQEPGDYTYETEGCDLGVQKQSALMVERFSMLTRLLKR
jgi:hypothetical protein